MPSIIRGVDDFDSLESQGLGDNQTWQDLTGSRSAGVTYTNTTGRPIKVAVTLTSTGSSFEGNIKIDGLICEEFNDSSNTSGSSRDSVSTIVPNGSTYFVTASASTVRRWTELR